MGDECVENEDDDRSPRRLISCHNRPWTTTTTTTTSDIPTTTTSDIPTTTVRTKWEKLEIEDRWHIIAVVFMSTTGILCCLVVWYAAVLCYTRRPRKNRKGGYSRAPNESREFE